MKRVRSGGGWPAIWYVLRHAQRMGWRRTWQALRSRNTCKTCAVGMGGQRGGMVNERGSFPEVCKKSLQALAADAQAPVPSAFFDSYTIQQWQQFSPYQLEHAGRLTTPLYLHRGSDPDGNDRYRPVSWETALNAIAQRLKSTPPTQTFWYFSGRSSNEAAFLLQVFARLYGTNHINNCSYYCHQASGVGLQSVLGTGTATVELTDLEHADAVMLLGGNPASNHPRLMSSLKQLRRRGGEVWVVNPMIETGLVSFRVPSDPWSLLLGSRIASLYVQPHIGGDLALLTALARRIVTEQAHEASFLQQFCEGWHDYREWLLGLDDAELVAQSGVPREQIDELARRYARAQRVIFAWTMGITHHTHGVENVEAIANLALLRGMVGRPGAGLLPIRGHSNVQGIGSMGVTPQLKQAFFDNLQQHFGVVLPTHPGLDTLGCLQAAARGELTVGVCLGGNLYGSTPDAQFARNALQRLDMLVYLNTTLNTGHAHGVARETYILPVLPRDEEPQATTQESMFNYVRLSAGGPARQAGPRSEIEVIARLAELVLAASTPVVWSQLKHTTHLRQVIARIVPGYQPLADIDQTRREFHVQGRILHEPRFPTPSGKAYLRRYSLPSPTSLGPAQVRLMTVRSEGQFNTVVYEEYDLYRGTERRDVILMHPDDLQRCGLRPGQQVRVTSAVGTLAPILAVAYPDIKPGNAAMYYPEANVLVPRDHDPRSKTPAFKAVLVSVTAWEPTVDR
ncbi:MAG: formate dehydrogenase [Planctomycetaceae bacterium]|nr:MAG: formate dehydrogenase [Planctomycetaceae bacterium]